MSNTSLEGSHASVFTLPDLGEGLAEAEVIRWLVSEGDVVTVNQPLVEVETAKAAVEIPSPTAGTVTQRHAAEGSTIEVGAPLVTFSTGSVVATPPTSDITDAASASGGSGPVLVGYGVTAGATQRRARKSSPSPHGTERPEAGPPGEAVKPVRHGGLEVGRAAEARFAAPERTASVRAKPPVRRLARELGVQLSDVRPTGPDATITREDVTAAAALASPSMVDGDRQQVRGVARAMAKAMTVSAGTIPQVTVWVEVDVTSSRRLLDRLRRDQAAPDGSITPLVLVARAVLAALRRQPLLNAHYDAATEEIVRRTTVNLGFAAATPRGLVVPNIKAADTLSFSELAQAVGQLTKVARDGAAAPTDLTGGTFTITNVGVFGVDGGTPLINPGEAAILAVGAWRQKPWVVDGQVVPRTVATVSLTFDHRLIDGATGSRFLRDVADLLEEPAADLAW